MKDPIKYGYCFWHEDGEFSLIPNKIRKLELDYVEVILTYPWSEEIPRS